MTYNKLLNWFVFFIFVVSTVFFSTVNAAEKNNLELLEAEIERPLEVLSRNEVAVSGDLVHIEISKPKRRDFSVYLGQTKAVMIEKADSWHILAGIDLNTVFGNYLLSAQTNKAQILQIPFTVNSFVNKHIESAPVMNQVKLVPEEKILKSLLWSNREPKLPLDYPSNGKWSDDFGAYYTPDKTKISEKNSKSGNLLRVTHLRSEVEPLTDIRSPGRAICFSIDFDEKTGYRVLLDHGMGLFSEISGLPNISIEEQDIVDQGDLISLFTKADFVEKNLPKAHTVFWRVFLTKALINPRSLTRNTITQKRYENKKVQESQL